METTVEQRRRSFDSFGALPTSAAGHRGTAAAVRNKTRKKKTKSRSERRLAAHIESKRRQKEIDALRLFPDLENASPDEYIIEVDSSTCASRKQRLVGLHVVATVCGSAIVAIGVYLTVDDSEIDGNTRKSDGPLGSVLLLIFGANDVHAVSVLPTRAN